MVLCDVVLTDVGERPIFTVAELRKLTGATLAAARAVASSCAAAPAFVLRGVDAPCAQRAAESLRASGAAVEVRSVLERCELGSVSTYDVALEGQPGDVPSFIGALEAIGFAPMRALDLWHQYRSAPAGRSFRLLASVEADVVSVARAQLTPVGVTVEVRAAELAGAPARAKGT